MTSTSVGVLKKRAYDTTGGHRGSEELTASMVVNSGAWVAPKSMLPQRILEGMKGIH